MDIDTELKIAQQRVEELREAQRQEARRFREEARRNEEAKKVEHAAELAADYLPGLPKAVTDTVYRYAWRDGHSSGYDAVEITYEEYAEVALKAWEAGKNG